MNEEKDKRYSIEEDQIVKKPKIYYMDSYEVKVENGEAAIPEEIMLTASGRQVVSKREDLQFRLYLNEETGIVTIRDCLEDLEDWEFKNYQRINFPDGKIKANFAGKEAPEGKRLTTVLFEGKKITLQFGLMEQNPKKIKAHLQNN